MDVVYATTDFPCEINGGRARVWKGSHWPADDPLVAEFPDRFSSDPRYGLQYSRQPDGFDRPQVEQATAAPGERRTVRRS
jgi:hypothetical protein